MAAVSDAAREAGRDPATLGMEGRVNSRADDFAELVDAWRATGASHLAVNTMGAGHQGADGHLAALSEVAKVVF
jgi:hypothetical protein